MSINVEIQEAGDRQPVEYVAKPGDWVLCWGQVVDRLAHDDDAVVEFFSHNEQYQCHVRRDRIEQADPPPFANQCNHMRQGHTNEFFRCELTDGHTAEHKWRNDYWSNRATAGYLEDA